MVIEPVVTELCGAGAVGVGLGLGAGGGETGGGAGATVGDGDGGGGEGGKLQQAKTSPAALGQQSPARVEQPACAVQAAKDMVNF